MPDKEKPGNVTCPRCSTLLTTADRITKNAIQALFWPNSRRYQCDSCGLKFTVSPTSSTSAPRNSPTYELPPLRIDSVVDTTRSGIQKAAASRSGNGYVHTRPRTTRLYITDVPEIPGIHNSADKAALKRQVQADEALQQEVKRLRQIEKKYRQLKKANRYLAKASSQRREM